MPHPSSIPDSDARKRVLFCPHCGYASGIDGDWIVRRTDDREVFACPDCDAVVTTRPPPGAV